MKWLLLLCVVLFVIGWTILLSNGVVFIAGLFGVKLPLWVGYTIVVLLNMVFCGKR